MSRGGVRAGGPAGARAGGRVTTCILCWSCTALDAVCRRLSTRKVRGRYQNRCRVLMYFREPACEEDNFPPVSHSTLMGMRSKRVVFCVLRALYADFPL